MPPIPKRRYRNILVVISLLTNKNIMKTIHKIFHTALVCLVTMCFVRANADDRPPHGVFTCQYGEGEKVIVTIINDDIIKVSHLSGDEQIPVSQSVILPPSEFTGKAVELDDRTVISTGSGLSVTLGKNDGSVSISAGNRRVIYDTGERNITNGRQEIKLFTLGDCTYYGAGERGYTFDLAGDTLVMYNKQNYGYKKEEERIKQMNITMPLFYSSNGYAVLFDDFAAAEMIMGNPVKYVSESKQPISYYFINGGQNLAETVTRFTSLVGRQELPPLWSLGYITSKYGYKTAKETTGVIDTLKMKGYPVDGVVLDLYWYGKEEDMGRLAWEPAQWQDHKKMLSNLKRKNVNTIIISQPYVLTNGKAIDNYRELSGKGMFCKDSIGNTHDVTIWVGSGGMFDVSNPDTRQWLRDRYKLLTDEGVGGWWGDLGEPEVHPETIFHHNGLTARQYHNQYGNDWSRIIYDLYKEEYPDTRLMTLMRGGTAGLQRYSVFPWSTDVSRSWGGLQPQITIMLNSGLSGLGYMSHDVGGFAITEDKVVDPELYVRWLQLGTFSPVLRTHAQQVAEPYRYGEHQDIILDLIKTRYQWLPYNYSLAFENALWGYPLVRPLHFYDAHNKFNHPEDQYLWGGSIMVAPVLEPGVKSRDIIMPQYGEKWYDYNNPAQTFNPGETISYDTPLNTLPIFAKAGSFITLADYKMGNTGDYNTSRYTVKYFPQENGTSTSTLFEDDGKSTTSIKDNAYSRISYNSNVAGNTIGISVNSEGTYKNAPKRKSMKFVIYGIKAMPKEISVNGKAVNSKDVKYDPETASVTFDTKWDVAKDLNITIIR